MKKIATFISALMVASAAAVSTDAQAQGAKPDGKFLWRGDTIMAASHRLQKEVLEDWAVEISKRSQGRLEIKFFPGGQLGLGPANALRVLQARTVEVVGFVYSASGGDMPLLNFASLPMLYSESGPEGVADMWRKTRPIWERELAKFDVMPGLFGMADEQIVYNSRRPIKKLEDFRGLKLRFYSREQAQFLQLLGASPTSVPYNDMVSAAQRGVIDGVITGGYTGVAFSLWDARQKHALVDVGLDYVPFFLGISHKAWMELPPELQAIVRQVNKESEAKVVGVVKSIQSDSWKTLESHGVAITRLPAADLAKARAAGKKIADAWLAKAGPVGKELMDAVQGR